MSRMGISTLWGKVAALIAVCGWCLSAQAKYAGGSGTEAEPFRISGVSDWQELIATPADWGSHFVLTADIDLNDVPITPVGNDANNFTGVFDGNDYVIRNADVNMPESDFVGLFGWLGWGGQIKNLGVEDASIFGGYDVGGLVGANGGAITNCYSTGSVGATDYYVGGLVGGNSGPISNCYSTGSVSGRDYVGGLVGDNGGAISNCYSSGPVTGIEVVGGLVGWNGGTISDCYSIGSVSGTGYYVGGLVGNNGGCSPRGGCWYGTVAACFWDTQTSGLSTSAGGTGLTTGEMQTARTFQVWGTCGNEGVWTIDEGNDYPRLWWQNQPGEAIRLAMLSDLLLGTGTQNDPFLIYTPEELNMVGLFPCEWDKHFKLMADIDLSGFDGKDGRPAFNIIAPGGMGGEGYFIGTPFSGVFDGNDYVIRNVDVNMPESDFVGLFGYLGWDGQIKNLGAEDISILGRYYVGGLVGYNDGTISNCYSSGSVSGDGDVGGLLGHNGYYYEEWPRERTYSGRIDNCYSTGSVSGDYDVGGLVGINYGTISNSYSTDSVSATDYSVGGLVGHNYGTISNCYSTASVSGGSYVGGLVGGSYGTISNCYSTGSVSAESYVGGLVGINYGTISNSYSTGSVNGTGDYVGGLVGGNSGAISNCYSTASVSGGSYVGGLVGYNSGAISNSFWDTDTSGWTTSAGGMGKTTAEMKTASTYFAWGLCGSGGAWTIDEGNDYPRLAWENKPGHPLEYRLSDFLEGSGTADDPYIISTDEQLNLIGVFTCEWDKHFLLTNDVNLADYTGTKFNIIGMTNNPFTGVFDGNGHKIWNFTWSSTGGGNIGLFAYVGAGGLIKNLGMENVDVNAVGGYRVGGLVGTNSGTISNCYSSGSVSGDDDVGGLLGLNSGNISNCYSSGSVSGTGDSVGGLVGSSSGAISDCYSTGTVTGTGSYVGGLVGYNSGGTITSSYSTSSVGANQYVGGLVGRNYGDIVTCYSGGSVSGDHDVGGLVGGNGGTISNCYSSGPVSGDDNVGGLVGYNDAGRISNCYSTGSVGGSAAVGGLVGLNDETITNCYCTGSVSGDWYVGGLVGANGGAISNCYSTGSVVGSGTGYYVGGLVGRNLSGTIGSSFWDVNTSGWTTSAGGMGKTTTQMQAINTFLEGGWDFLGETANGTSDFWQMPWSGGYPVLSILNGYIPAEPPGSGSEADPYIITDVNELGTVWYRPSGYYVLGNDIDLAGITWSDAVVPFFSGVFDGNDYVIRNVDVNVPGAGYVGLFGYLGTNGQIRNLGVEDASIFAAEAVGSLVGVNRGTIINCYSSGSVSGTGDYVGGLVGLSDAGAISNCYWIGPVSGNDDVGGLVGQNYSGAISDCYSAGSVSGANNVGGLVGYNYRYGAISDCYSTASVNGTGSYVGGLVGYNYYYGTISNCYSTGSVTGTRDYFGGLVGWNELGTISNCYSTGSVSGRNYVGGLVGENGDRWGEGWGWIANCYSSGSVSGDHDVGGLVGGNNGTISNCYSTGTVGSRWGDVGGLVGNNWGAGAITNCYSTGSVSGTDYVGGLVGWKSGTISNCYSSGSVSGRDYVGGLVGRNYGAISNSYSTGSVSGRDYVGGLVGYYYRYGTISNCYSTGSVSGSSYLGGLVGTGDPNLVTASFWDKDTSGWTTSAGGEGKTTADMMTQSTFTSAGWDFLGEAANGTKDTWRMCVDEVDYPRLTWEYVQGGDFACPDGVNGGDLKVLCEDWLSSYSQALYGADADGDKHVTSADFAILAQRWLNGIE